MIGRGRPCLSASLIGAALATVLLLPSGSSARAQDTARLGRGPRPDSSEVLSRARRAQARYERRRLRYVTRVWTGSGGRCDVRVGRMCVWHDPGSTWEPEPEDPEVGRSREELLGELARAAELLPGDGWILGQRIHYLTEAGRWEDAAAVLEDCRADAEWCEALRGFVLHGLERYPEARAAFERALDRMEAGRAREWRDPAVILDPRAREWIAEGPFGATVLRRLWMLSDPLFLVDGNDRLTEHYARRVMARMREDARSPFGRWNGDLEEVLIRFGWEVGWERTHPAPGSVSRDGSVIGQTHPRARQMLPPPEVLRRPEATEAGGWHPEEEWVRSAYAPAYAPDLDRLEGQVAVFRFGDSIRVIGAYELPEAPETYRDPWENHLFAPTAPRPGGTVGGLFLAAPDRSVVVASARAEGAVGVMSLSAAAAPWVVSLEALDPATRRGARLRYGLAEEPYPDGVPVLSDLLLLSGAASPVTLEEAIPRARPHTRVRPDETVGVAFAVSGLRGGEWLGLRLVLEAPAGGFLQRAGEWLGIVDEGRPVSVEWEEEAPEGGEFLFRTVSLRLPRLDPGRYRLRLSVSLPGRSPMTTVRDVQVSGGGEAR